MKRLLACTCVLVGTTLAVAAGADAPVPKSRNQEIKPMPSDTTKDGPARATKDQTHGTSNETIAQPKRIRDSYPLDGSDERHRSVAGIQQLTVDLLALHNMYKETHWNLTGPLYLQLHEYYDKQATGYLEQADVFAERVLQLGTSVDGRFSTIARTTTIPEMPAGYLTDNESIQLLLDRVTILQKEIYQLIRTTEQIDAPTSNKLQDLGYAVDKNLWQLRAHLERPGSEGESLPWVGHQ